VEECTHPELDEEHQPVEVAWSPSTV